MHARSLLSIAAMGVMGAALPAHASGTGPSGSSEDTSNQVTCNSYPNEPTRFDVERRTSGVAVHGNTGTVYLGTDGVEACGDNGSSWRGRVYVTSKGVTYDGATWGADPQSADNGCTTVGLGGVTSC